MKTKEAIFVEKGTGLCAPIRAGDRVEFRQPNPAGQVVDVNIFNVETGERLWASRTGQTFGMHVTVGDDLLSTPPHERTMMVITKDSMGSRRLTRPANDVLFGRCSLTLRRRIYGSIAGNTPGCQEILASAITSYGLSEHDVHDALNLFMQTWVDENDELSFHSSEAQAGDVVELEARMDCLIAISACPGASSSRDSIGILVK